jgi:hypothetical protein
MGSKPSLASEANADILKERCYFPPERAAWMPGAGPTVDEPARPCPLNRAICPSCSRSRSAHDQGNGRFGAGQDPRFGAC